MEGSTNPRFNASTSFELLLRVLKLDVRVMHWPNDSVDIPGNCDEECIVSKSLDCSLLVQHVNIVHWKRDH